MMNHPDLDRLLEYLDKTGDAALVGDISQHLQECEECRMKLQSFRRLESAMRRVRDEKTSTRFTQGVMAKLGIAETSPRGWNIIQSLAPIIALAAIIGIVYGVFEFTGAYQGSDIQQSVGFTQTISSKLGNVVAAGISMMNAWARKYFGFAGNNYGVAVFLVLFFAVVGILDKFVLMPRMKRRS